MAEAFLLFFSFPREAPPLLWVVHRGPLISVAELTTVAGLRFLAVGASLGPAGFVAA